jgi:HSP20 family protein
MADLIRRTPRTLVPRIFPEVDELFREIWGRPILGASGRGRATGPREWAPQVDLYETDTEFVVKAELPGVAREDIEILCEGRNLSLRAERKKDEEVAEESYYWRERLYGHFERLVQLPADVAEESVTAKFDNGVLEVRAMKKGPEPKGRKIDVA